MTNPRMPSWFRKHIREYLGREHSQFFYQTLTLAPRVLLHCASAAALVGLATGCVSQTQYEEARSAGQVEMGARQQAEQRLHEAEIKLAALEAELKVRDQKLSADEQQIAQSKLDGDVANKERDDASALVEQLRGELARVGGDLRTFATQKESLERALDTAEAKQKRLEQAGTQTATLVRMTRDLSASMGDSVMSGDLSIDAKDGGVVLHVPHAVLFAEDKSVRKDIAIRAIARVLERYPGIGLSLSESGQAADHADLAALSAAICQQGIAVSRLRRIASSDKVPNDGQIDLTLAPSAPQPDSTAPVQPQAVPSERAAL